MFFSNTFILVVKAYAWIVRVQNYIPIVGYDGKVAPFLLGHPFLLFTCAVFDPLQKILRLAGISREEWLSV